jgi:hypothetical protein
MKYKDGDAWVNSPPEDELRKYEGFVYIITNLTSNKRYIGRKYFWSLQKVKGKKRRVRSESDWKTYWGSSLFLHEAIKNEGIDNFKREIVSYHRTRGQVNSAEVELQWEHDVIHSVTDQGDRTYYNESIGGKKYTTTPISEATKLKMKNACVGKSMYKDSYGNIVKLKMSHPDVINGLVVGVNSGVKRIHINNGIESKFILPDELDQYIMDGWSKGRLPLTVTNARVASDKAASTKRWMTNGDISVHVFPCDFDDYSGWGFRFGRTFAPTSKHRIKQLDMDGNFIQYFASNAEAKRKLGADASAVIHGRQISSKGFKWERG